MQSTERTFILVKEFNNDFVNISIEPLSKLEKMEVTSKRVVVWETQQPQRLMGRIYTVFRRSHVSGPLYGVSFDELYAFMVNDVAAKKLIVQSAKREDSSSVALGIIGGILAGCIVLIAIAWGVVEAIAIGILGAILLSKK